jgi:hypothetical protein
VSSSGDVRQALRLGSTSRFYAIFSGYFLATQPGIYTFQLWKNSTLNDTLRMTVSDSARIELFNGTNCSTYTFGYCAVTATCVLESPGHLYFVSLEYSRDDSSNGGGNFSMNFQFKNASFSSMMTYVFPPIGTKPDTDVLVSPSSAKVASSIVTGNCLTLATAGTSCQFSISARDEFGSASVFPSNVSVLCSSLIDSSFVSGNVVSVDGSILTARYVPGSAGNHILSVFFKYSTLQWTLLVFPAPFASSQSSIVQGPALSLATAGSLSIFTIFAIDKYGNMLERVQNIAVNVENEASSEYHAVPVVSNRAFNTMVFKDMTVTYRITTAGNYRISVSTLDPGLSMFVYSESSRSASAVYLTTTDDINLLSYYALGSNLFMPSNVTFSKLSFSGFISATSSTVFSFKVLYGSTSDVVSLRIDRIKLIDSNATNDAISNSYLLESLDSSTLNDAVVKVNWPDSSSWINTGNQAVFDPTINSVRFQGSTYLDAGSKTWNIHASGFGITASIMIKSMTANQRLVHFFNSGTNKWSIILEFVKNGGGFDIRFLIYNEPGDEVNSGCMTSSSDQPLRTLNSKYVITASYDVSTRVSKIYVDGLLRKQCSQGANAAVGPRTLQFSFIGKASDSTLVFIGQVYALAIYDRPLDAQEVVYQHYALKGLVPVATIALVASTLYEFQLNYSAVNFSRVGLMVCSHGLCIITSNYLC